MAKIELCRNDEDLVYKGWTASGEYRKVFYLSVKLLACALGLAECIDFWSADSHNWRCDEFRPWPKFNFVGTT